MNRVILRGYSLRLSVAVTACLLLACIGALNGCTRAKVKLGWKAYLDKIPVTSMAVRLPNGPGIAPGEKSPLVLTFTEPDGKVVVTEGAGHGKILWKDIKIASTVVDVNQKGVLSLPVDPRLSDGKMGHVVITVPSHPNLRAELDVPPRYDFKYVLTFSGSTGSSGMNGIAGQDGLSGSSGSLDPNNPSRGGDGGNGSDGSRGQDGGRGGDAPPVQLRVALRSGNPPLLQVSVSAAGGQKLYLIDPQRGSLNVAADGGSGGSGGKGGRGGRGGSGGIGSPNGNNGRDGLDGHNGWDGSSGNGGTISVTYDPQAKPYLTAIHLSNRGGPTPSFHEEPVAPLW